MDIGEEWDGREEHPDANAVHSIFLCSSSGANSMSRRRGMEKRNEMPEEFAAGEECESEENEEEEAEEGESGAAEEERMVRGRKRKRDDMFVYY